MDEGASKGARGLTYVINERLLLVIADWSLGDGGAEEKKKGRLTDWS